MKLIWQARCKTDPVDARKLAELLRTNLLPVIWVAPPEVRERRRLLRGRAYLVRLRTSVKNRIHGHLMAENQRLEVGDLYGRAGRAWLRTVALSPMARLQVDLLLELADHLSARVARLDRRVQRLVRGDPEAQLTHGCVGRMCSPWLKWILIEIVQSLKLTPGPIGHHYQKLLRAKGKAKATVAAARQLCCYLYWCLREGWSYEQWLQQHGSREVRPLQTLGSAA